MYKDIDKIKCPDCLVVGWADGLCFFCSRREEREALQDISSDSNRLLTKTSEVSQMQNFKRLNPEPDHCGEAICKNCGHTFDFDACGEDNCVESSQHINKLVLQCPNCQNTEEDEVGGPKLAEEKRGDAVPYVNPYRRL